MPSPDGKLCAIGQEEMLAVSVADAFQQRGAERLFYVNVRARATDLLQVAWSRSHDIATVIRVNFETPCTEARKRTERVTIWIDAPTDANR